MEIINYIWQFRPKKYAESYNFFECDFCALMFRSKAQLNMHTNKHFERKMCTDCGKILIRICNDWYELHAAANCDREHSSWHPSHSHSETNRPIKTEKNYLSSEGEEADHYYDDRGDEDDFNDRYDNVDNSVEPIDRFPSVNVKPGDGDRSHDKLFIVNAEPNTGNNQKNDAAIVTANETKSKKTKAGPKSWKKWKEREVKKEKKKKKCKKPNAPKFHNNVDKRPQIALTRIDSDGEEVPIPPVVQPKLKCHLCNKELLNKRTLGYHLRDVHNYNKTTPKKSYTCDICDICDRSYTTFRSLKVHMFSHAGVKPFVCCSCGRGFYQMTHLRKHELIHSEERPHECNLCGKTFKSRSNLQAHTRIHTGERPYHCKFDDCVRTFANSSDLKRHEHTAHGLHAKKYNCPICARPFFEKQWMLKHMQTHSKIVADDDNVRKSAEHICAQCRKSFPDRSRLQAHMRSHTGEKPFRCKIDNCQRAYAYSNDLKRHEHKEHGLHIKYQCEVCSKSFFEMKSLVKHIVALHQAKHIKVEN